MKTIDRIIISTLSIGIWVLLISLYFDRPSYALDADAIEGLRDYVKEVVEENCTVYGEVYVYEIADSEGFGELEETVISCESQLAQANE